MNKYLFHPMEVSICGHSGSGKSTLIQKLIRHYSTIYRVGYIKHDAHQFEMDKKGKDSYEAKVAGAKSVGISGAETTALLLDNQDDRYLFRQNFIDSDIVFIEGYKESLCHKILMWSGSEEDHTLLEKYTNDPTQQLLAIVGISGEAPNCNIPYFKRDHLNEIVNFLDKYWDDKIRTRPLHGLVLSGGYSKRMGQDKGKLSYHGQNQTSFLYDLLEKVTEKSFISCRNEQKDQTHLNHYPLIEDQYLGFGPTGGILSAFSKYPESAWLVVACDMPYLDEKVINKLIEKRNPFKLATCYFNEERNWPEPLCTIYEPKAALKLGQYLAIGKPCPRKVLMNSEIESLTPPSEIALGNVNTPDEYHKAQKKIIMPRTLS